MLNKVNGSVNSLGHLEIGGVDAINLIKQYKTPLYVFDKKRIEDTCLTFNNALEKYYGKGRICYASKAFCCKEIYRIIKNCNLGADVVSLGEMYTAKSVNFDFSALVFHGNNKTYEELEFAVKNGIGLIVIDSLEEIETLNLICSNLNVKANVLVRVNPGIEAHTHHYIQTSKVDSKFGFSITNGDCLSALEKIKNCNNLSLKGLHCHIGSQIFEIKSYLIAVQKMLDYYNDLSELGYEFDTLNLGGGFGIYYNENDSVMTLEKYDSFIKEICNAVKEKLNCYKHLQKPFLIFEPGRSIVGEAGYTLYTVGSVKEIKNIKNYLAVDGGMYENPRHALYQAEYTVVAPEKMCEKPVKKYTVAGKCCESGDVITEDVFLPEMKKGDYLCVLSTGAYNYSMASNYNRNLIPEVVFAENGSSYVAVKRQNLEDIVKNDL